MEAMGGTLMLTYSFENIGSNRLYEYLYKCIKKDILNGKLKAEDKLPSKRTFAKNLNVSTITVENAYAQLMAEGYIYSKPKKGYFVSELNAFSYKTKNGCKTSGTESENCIIDELDIRNQKDKAEQEDSLYFNPKKKGYLADFVSNRIHQENFPFSIWAKITREVLADNTEILLYPPPSGGVYELRKAISDHLYAFRGMSVMPEQVIIGAGTEYLYGLLIQLFGEKAIYAIEDPGYEKIAQIYASHSRAVRYISMDEEGILMESLEASKADILHLSPSHHYPTGIVTPIKRRYEILDWASKDENRYIIEDDYDSEFRLIGKPIPALQSIDTMEKVIYMNTFSKSLSSTIRMSYMILPKHLLKRFYEKLGFYSCTVSNFEQYTLARFISNGYFEKHINRMRNYYRGQRNLLLEEIKNSELSSHIRIREEHAGLHFLMDLDTEISDKELEQRALQAGIRLSCLSDYFQNPSNAKQHAVVINYSGLDPEKIKEAVIVLSHIILK